MVFHGFERMCGGFQDTFIQPSIFGLFGSLCLISGWVRMSVWFVHVSGLLRFAWAVCANSLRNVRVLVAH
eukprot:14501049-Alexandrium_andersonii.AAC.1